MRTVYCFWDSFFGVIVRQQDPREWPDWDEANPPKHFLGGLQVSSRREAEGYVRGTFAAQIRELGGNPVSCAIYFASWMDPQFVPEGWEPLEAGELPSRPSAAALN